jgi:uncharacterized membrane protein YoaK (UPF0700 family)
LEGKGKLARYIHYTMAVVGGFLAAYAILNRNGLLANAQTMNLLTLLLSLLGRNARDVLIHTGALLLYILGTVLTVILTKKTSADILLVSVLIDCGAVLVLGFLPQNMNEVIALYPIFFAMSVQWNAFKGVDGYISSSIFSTNNVKQLSISFTEFLIDHDKSHLDRAGFFGSVLLSFHAGAVLSYFSNQMFGLRGVWICFIPLYAALCLTACERLLREKSPEQAANDS